MKRVLALASALLVLLLGGGALTTATAQPASPRHSPGPDLVIVNPRLETVYRAITPCRIADTRHSTAGIIAPSSSRAFYVRGSAGFTSQGGTAASCHVPSSATAVTVNATVTGTTGAGFLVNYPAGSAEPLSNFVFYQKGSTLTANPTFALAATAEPSLEIHASGGASAHLILDVTGYYLPQIQAYVHADGTLRSSTPRILSSSLGGTGAYAVTVDSDVSTCSAVATTWTLGVGAVATTSGSTVYVQTYVTNDANDRAIDAPFNLVVTC